MPTLDDLRTEAEAKLEKVLAKLDARHRAMLHKAIQQYGLSIPDSVWQAIQKDQESEEVAAVILLLFTTGDEWTTAEIQAQGVKARGYSRREFTSYAFDAQRRTQQLAASRTVALRNRVRTKVQDAILKGDVGTLPDEAIDEALDEVFAEQRRKTTATDETTGGFSKGQRGAAERAGDGATTADGKKTTIALIWKTERDNLVCSRCSPLEGQPEEVWGLVFPQGPGPECHPNCRCSLEVRLVPYVEVDN